MVNLVKRTVSWKWVVLWTLWACRLVRQPTLPVLLSNGMVRGMIDPDGTNRQYLAIPYASVTERFQDPAPEPTWDTLYEAINEHVRCNQNVNEYKTIGQKDCLTLNVFTPIDSSPDSKLPVMVFIHGGGFFKGSGSTLFYGPRYLVPKGVILVTINYRLNIQGFLCLGIKENPGNAAMKDQAAALRWVKKNIQVLGGDPENVILFGESAGAASVSFHLYSPMSKGLFHKAIVQSGSALSPWAFQYKPVYLASLLAKVMLYDSQDPYKLYKYFMNKTDDELILTRVPRKEGALITSEILYSPCVEKQLDGVEPFLTESPYDLMTRGEYNRVPLIIGTNIEEGMLIIGLDNDTMIPKTDFKNSLPKNLHIPLEKDQTEIAEKLQKMYLGDALVSMNTAVNISRFLGELNLNYPSLQEKEILLKTTDQPIYSYLFKYDGWRNLPKIFLPSRFKAPGATHADELFYIFSQYLFGSNGEKHMINTVTTLWTNFAKYGNPTPEGSNLPFKWHRTNATTPTTLVIDKEITTVPLWFNDRLKYIKEVYSKFRRKR